MKNHEDKLNQEISGLKVQNEKYQNEITQLKLNYKNEISNLKEERKKLLLLISSILFIILFIFNYIVNDFKTSINNIIKNNNNEFLYLKDLSKKILEENNKLKDDLQNDKRIKNLSRDFNQTKSISKKNEKLNNTAYIKSSFDSNILESIYSIDFILDYIKENDKSINIGDIKLLFSGSRYGDNTIICHELCDNKPNVLIIMKSDDGFIFGGYSKIGFKKKDKDANSFLFSIDLKKVYPAIKDKNVINSNEKNRGLCFTGSLCFYDNFMNRFNYIGDYIDKYFNGFEEKFEMNGGNKKFICKELEVFQLLRKKVD